MQKPLQFLLGSTLVATAAFFSISAEQPAPPPTTAALALDASQSGPVINKNVYGQFAEHLGHCIYGGIWVGEDSPIPNTRGMRNDVLTALKNLKVPVVRWPGGCFADEYHWKDGIGPREKRPSMINTHWGGVVENNQFGTHEFMDFCELIGAEPYVCGNVGSGSVQEMMEWVEYMTSPADSPMANLRRANGREQPWKLPFFAVGNESWGCGGNMRPEYYADLYRRYNTFVKNYQPGAANRIARVAGGPNAEDYRWTEVMMANVPINQMNGLSLHYYTLPTGSWSGSKGSSTNFGENHWFSTLQRTLRMDEIITRHSAIMDQRDRQRRVALVVDEWGTWYDVLPGTNGGFLRQQNSLRDALVAGLNFHIFHKHAARVTMANIAQMVNVLQAMILTENEKMVLTPTYWAFEMHIPFQGATSLPLTVTSPSYSFNNASIPAVSASAARTTDGRLVLSLVNTDPERAIPVECAITGASPASVSGRVLTAPAINTINTFEVPEAVKPAPFTDAKLADGKLTLTLPAKSLVVLQL